MEGTYHSIHPSLPKVHSAPRTGCAFWLLVGVLLLWPLGAQAAPTASHFQAGYDDGFYLRDTSGAYSLHIQACVQVRLTLRAFDGDKGEALQQTELAVYIRRGRLTLEGTVFSKELTYKMQLALDRGFAKLKDFFLDYSIWKDQLAFRAGQFKRPFSRQFLTSGKRQEFVGRSILHDFFWIDRDLGVMFHNDNGGKGWFGWSLGVFNGTEDDLRHLCDVENDPTSSQARVTECEVTHRPPFVKPALVGRIQFHTPGFKGRSEGDLKGGPLRLAIGAGVYIEWDADQDGEAGMQFEADAMLKAWGFAFTTSVQLSTREQAAGFFEQKLHGIAAMGQISYVLMKRYQLAFRYAFLYPLEETVRQELSSAMGIYFLGHQLKWQIEVTLLYLEQMGRQTPFFRARTQLQCSF